MYGIFWALCFCKQGVIIFFDGKVWGVSELFVIYGFNIYAGIFIGRKINFTKVILKILFAVNEYNIEM